MSFAQREELPPRIEPCPLIIQLVGLSHGSPVEHVSSGNRVFGRKVVINLGCKIILGRDLLSRESKNPSISGSGKTRIAGKGALQRSIRRGPEGVHKFQNRESEAHGYGPAAVRHS